MTQYKHRLALVLILFIVPFFSITSFSVGQASSGSKQYAFIPKDDPEMILTVSSLGETVLTIEGEYISFSNENMISASSAETHWLLTLDSGTEYEFSLETPLSRWSILFCSTPHSPAEYAGLTLNSGTNCTVQFDPSAPQGRMQKMVLCNMQGNIGLFSS